MTAGAKNKKQNYAGLGQLIRLWRVLLGEFDDLIGWSIESIGMMGGGGGEGVGKQLPAALSYSHA